MNKCHTANPACSSGDNRRCDHLSENVSNHVNLRAQNRDCKNRQGPGYVAIHSQEPRQRPLSTISTSNVIPHSHQRRWSADFCKCGTSNIITVRKSKKEPQPPQRSVSLPQPHTATRPLFKRYSCPPIGVSRSPSNPSFSSSSSSSTNSCSSPPPVQTSVITGRDPLGWKLQPKSSSTSSRACTKRLSLQIPLPVIFPDPTFGHAPNFQSDDTRYPDPSPKTKPPLRPKPSRRHSDSSAFRRSLPLVTLDELCAVHLRPVSLLDESDDVFSTGKEEKVKVTTPPGKTPPPVPEKTPMARQIAQLIAHSHQNHTRAEANIYCSVMKPKHKYSLQTEDGSRLKEKKTGLRVDPSCDRERSTPRFPG